MINIRLEGQGKQIDGRVVPIPSKMLLFQRGPVLPVIVEPNAAFVLALQASGKPIPAAITGIALVDTGATTTCIDGETAIQMGLAPNGIAKISSASHDSSECLTYPVKLQFPGWNVTLDSSKAMAVPIKNQGIIALVGRDLLQNCILVYNGVDGSFSLAL